jgi:large repetitive protein
MRYPLARMLRVLAAVILITSASCGGDPEASVTPDAMPPPPPSETEITEGPAEITSSTRATFVFTSSVSAASFTCRVDAAPFAPCSPPFTITVGEGPHTFHARAAGDDTAATLAWRVDLTPPETIIVSGPDPEMSMSEAVFSFASSEEASGFECALDGAALAPCTNPVAFSTLTVGEHRFVVRASDRAVNPDPTPAAWQWTVSAVTPETRVTSGPHSPWRETTVSFEFAADVDGARFECQLDDEPREACVSPATYDNLAEGTHQFQVWATDGAGRADPSPAVHAFSIDLAYW